jgi:hypothetical protein
MSHIDRQGGAGLSNACRACNADPIWTISRIGDMATSWACNDDLAAVCEWLQRDFEVTQLRVRLTAKSIEWNQMNHALNRIADGSDLDTP